jgi:arylsulfate sulfotransferase
MNARLITPLLALLCALQVAARPGQIGENLEVSGGPTPFISFVNTSVSDLAGFKFAQFLIWPKTGSATRPIKVRYARSYLEARGYFNSQNGNLTIPVFGLYAGRQNRVKITLGFSGQFDSVKGFGVVITTPAYDGGT